MKLIQTKTLFACTTALLILSACNSNKEAPVVKQEAEVTVNGKTISKLSVDLLMKKSGGSANNPEARKAIIDQLVLQMLVADEAVKKGLEKTPEVTEQVEVLKQSVLANAYVQDYIKSHPVGDDALKAEYEKIKAATAGSEYKARHILVATEGEARDIIAKLKKDATAFEKLAKEKSMDPGSKETGGDLGWFDLSKMVPEFSAAISAMEKGKITETPVKTQFGYHIIALDDSRPIQPPAFDDVKKNLAQQIQQQNLKKLLDDLKAKAKIEIAKAPAATPAPTPAATPAPAAAPAN